MAGVLDDDELSLEDALAYTQALVKAEAEHQQTRSVEDADRGAQVQTANLWQEASAAGPSNEDFIAAPYREYLVDIEDVGLQLDRKAARRRNGLYVTDFSSSEWCQQQVAFSLSAQIPKHLVETDAMRAGTKQHAVLEAETAGVAVEVTVETREDAFALRLLNMEAGLQQLLATSLTRELPICGFLQDCWVSGVIDQLEINEEGLIQISEQKTRFQPSLPSDSQKRTTALQVMIYRQLFMGLKPTFSTQNSARLLLSLGLDSEHSLSPALTQHTALTAGDGHVNLLTVLHRLQRVLECLPGCDPVLNVNYIWQGDNELLECEKVVFDQQFLEQAASKHLQFWRGTCPPIKVSQDERWKCKRCTFTSKCWPSHRKAVPWQH